jgi:hypothetical protein
MLKPALSIIIFLLSVKGHTQRLDFGGEFILPGISPSIVSTKYNYLTDDPVSFDFAKVKRHVQVRPGMNMGTGVFAEVSYRMFSVKALLFPIYSYNANFAVYFPEPELGEAKYLAGISAFGAQGQVNLKYSFKTIRNKKISLLAGGFYFRSYGSIDESESLLYDSELHKYEIYKHLLWDDRRYFYGASLGIEFSWLNKYRQNRRLTLLYNQVLTQYGYGGFRQGALTCQVGFANLKLFGTFKRTRIYIKR